MSKGLKKSSDFDSVYKCGKSFANKYLVMYVKENSLVNSRLGISVSRRVGNSVVRHRITRLIRESYRLAENMFNSGLDIIIIARAGVKDKNYFEVRDAMLHLGRLHKILKQ